MSFRRHTLQCPIVILIGREHDVDTEYEDMSEDSTLRRINVIRRCSNIFNSLESMGMATKAGRTE